MGDEMVFTQRELDIMSVLWRRGSGTAAWGPSRARVVRDPEAPHGREVGVSTLEWRRSFRR